MAGFLYFFPGRTAEDVCKDVASLPAAAAAVLRDVKTFPQDATLLDVHSKGPNQGAGCMLIPVSKNSGLPSIARNAPGKQIWHEADGYWIGWMRGEVPGAVDLERDETIRGMQVADEVGNTWQVPIARSPLAEFGGLPKTYTFAAGGLVKEHLRDEWQWLWDLAGQVNDAWRANVPLSELVPFVPTILGVNYRLGPHEINALHAAGHAILTEQFVASVTSALLHHSVIEEAVEQKKTDTSDPPAASS